MKVDAKEILYNVLADMDKDKIESTIVSKPSQIPSIIKEICRRCVKLLNFHTDSIKFRIYGDLNEVLIHYFLSITLIPSERKVKYHNDLEIDLVIPTLKQLRIDPTRTLVISFEKNLDRNIIDMHIDRLLKVQPNKTNIWLIFVHYYELSAPIKSPIPTTRGNSSLPSNAWWRSFWTETPRSRCSHWGRCRMSSGSSPTCADLWMPGKPNTTAQS